MRQFRDQRIEGEYLILKAGEVNYFGPNAEVVDCKLEIKVPTKDLVITRSHFLNCEFIFPKKTSNYDWFGANLESCNFKGTFIGHDFGHSEKLRYPTGAIKGCNFEEAILDGCRFFECDMGTIKLPKWPCFTILSPFSQIEMMKMSGGLALAELAADYEYATAQPTASTVYAPRLAERLGIDIDTILGEIAGKDWIIVNH